MTNGPLLDTTLPSAAPFAFSVPLLLDSSNLSIAHHPPACTNISTPTTSPSNVASIIDANTMPIDAITNIGIEHYPNANETPHVACLSPKETNENLCTPSSPINLSSDNSHQDLESANQAPFYIGQQFSSLEAYKTSVMTYANQRKYEIRYRNNTNFCAN